MQPPTVEPGATGVSRPSMGDHGIADRCAGVEDEIGEVAEFAAVGALAGAGLGVPGGDDGDDLEAAAAEAFGHFDGDDVAAAGGDDQGGVLGVEVEIAEDAFGEAGHVFEEHGLALAVRTDHQVMEAEGEFDDRVEAREGAVAGPHFLDQDSAVAGAEEVDHASGEDGGGEPVGSLPDQAQLGVDGEQQFAAAGEVGDTWSHGVEGRGIGGGAEAGAGRACQAAP
jgi:hypothetical protein